MSYDTGLPILLEIPERPRQATSPCRLGVWIIGTANPHHRLYGLEVLR